MAERLDLLVCELSHFSPDEIFAYLRKRRIKEVAFVHIGRAYRQNMVKLRRRAKEMLGRVKCVFPDDRDEIRLNRR